MRFRLDQEILELHDLPRSKERYIERIYFSVEQPYLDKVNEVNGNQDGLMHQLEKQFIFNRLTNSQRTTSQRWINCEQALDFEDMAITRSEERIQKGRFPVPFKPNVNIKAKVKGQLYRVQIESGGGSARSPKSLSGTCRGTTAS